MADEEIKEDENVEVKTRHEGHPRGKKVSRMSLNEIDTALKNVEATMGGFNSAYARQLLARKEMLQPSRGHSVSKRKAA